MDREQKVMQDTIAAKELITNYIKKEKIPINASLNAMINMIINLLKKSGDKKLSLEIWDNLRKELE